MSGEKAASAAQPSLAGFYAARLDEDEADIDSPWPTRERLTIAAHRAILALHQVHSEPGIQNIDHHDKRWNTGWVERRETGHAVYWCETCDHDRDYGHIGSAQEGCDTLRIVAAVYSDHPGYQGEWKP